MGLDAVSKAVDAFIAPFIRAGAALGKRQCQSSALNADAIFAVVEDAQSPSRLGQVRIAMVAPLKHGLLNHIIGSGGTLNAAKLNFVPCVLRPQIGGEADLQYPVLLMPVQHTLPLYQGAVTAENHILLQERGCAQGIAAVQAELPDTVNGHLWFCQTSGRVKLHQAVRINVPAVPPCGNILRQQQRVHGGTGPLHPICTGDEGDDVPRFIQFHLQQRGEEGFAGVNKGAVRLMGFSGNQMQHRCAQCRTFQTVYCGGGLTVCQGDRL